MTCYEPDSGRCGYPVAVAIGPRRRGRTRGPHDGPFWIAFRSCARPGITRHDDARRDRTIGRNPRVRLRAAADERPHYLPAEVARTRAPFFYLRRGSPGPERCNR